MFIKLSEAAGFVAEDVKNPDTRAEAKRNQQRALWDLPSERGKSYSQMKERRTYQPVRRHSHLKGREGTFWRGLPRKDARQIVLAARKYELETREAGNRNGALGTVALEILDYLTNLVDYRTGRLDPSLHTLMEKLHRSKDAVVRALKALRMHGFIDWIRRYIPADDDSGRVQVQQTSNAYRLSMPQRALKLLGRYAKAAPIPDDAAQRVADHVAADEEHKAALSLAELPLFEMGEDNPLAQTLSRLGALIDGKNRESAKRSESLSKDSSYKEKSEYPSQE